MTREIAGFNAAVAHRAEVVVGAGSQEDVVQAVRFARRAAGAWPCRAPGTARICPWRRDC